MGNKAGIKPKRSVTAYRKRQSRLANIVKAQSSQQMTVAAKEPSSASADERISAQSTVITPDTEAAYVREFVVAHGSGDTISFAQSNESCDRSSSHSLDVECLPPSDTNSFVIENETAKETETFVGRRIVNVSQFFNKLQDISTHGPLGCDLKCLKIVSEKRNGLISQIRLKCQMCKMSFIVNTDTADGELDVNTSAVGGTIAIGCGYSQMSEISAAIGLPMMTHKVFSAKMDIVHEKWESELLKSMNEAAEEERRLAIEKERVDSEGIAIIDVIADGCYSKRSYKKNYSSLSGAAAIIGRRTKKILYLAIKNKYCSVCAVAKSSNKQSKDHTCYKNFAGASTAMESEILVEGFKKSIEMHNLIYGRLISDGDANTYSKILQARPYSNFTVEKVECRNHLLRNLCNKLCAISTDTKFPLKFRKYVTKKRVLCIRKVVTEAIRTNKNSGSIASLHQDIIAAPDHAFGRHGKCKHYFCSKTEDDQNVEQEMFSNVIYHRIKLIISQLAAHSRSLIVDVDSNAVEGYHSVVAKFVGGKRVNFSQKFQYQMRCKAAALAYNTHKPMTMLHKSIIGKSPRNQIKRMEDRKHMDRQRAQKYSKKKRRLFEKEDPKNYGENCSKPDMEEEMLEQTKKLFLQSLIKDDNERTRIIRETVLQSGSSEWLEIRRNILTASNFGRVIRRRVDTSCHNIVKDILYKSSIEHVSSIKHGKDHERDAINQLAHQEGVEINPCGLFIDPDIPFLGATPDGVIGENTIVEVKCPKTTYNMGVAKAIEAERLPFYKKNKNGLVTINKLHYWYYQIQGQLNVARKEQCLFGIWSGNELPMKTEMIKRDELFWVNDMEPKLKAFYLDCLLPELVDPRHTRQMPIRDPTYIVEAIKRKKDREEREKPNTALSLNGSKKRKSSSNESRVSVIKAKKLKK